MTGQERPIGNLPGERSIPASRDRGAAGWARAVGGDSVAAHVITEARHNGGLARRTARVLEIADLAWPIACINEPQTGVASDPRGAQQVIPSGIPPVRH